MSVQFMRNGSENNRSAWLVRKRLAGHTITVATIVWSGDEWILRSGAGRIDRFDRLPEAKDEARKI